MDANSKGEVHFWVHALGCQVSLAYHIIVLKIIRLSGGLTGPHTSGKELSAGKPSLPNGMFHYWNLKLFNFQVIATVPFIPGHECVGTVYKAGPEATLSEGQKVGIENHFFCGSCYQVSEDWPSNKQEIIKFFRGQLQMPHLFFQCTHNLKEICQNMGQYGHGRKTMHGGCSEYSIVSSKYCYPLTRDLSRWKIFSERQTRNEFGQMDSSQN